MLSLFAQAASIVALRETPHGIGQLGLITLAIGKRHANMQCTNTEQEAFFIALNLFFKQRNELLRTRRLLQHAVDKHFGKRSQMNRERRDQ